MRLETRLRTRGRLSILSDGALPIDAKVLDTSPSGMGIESPVQLKAGTTVRLICCGVEVAKGTIQYCRTHGDRFVAGVAFS